MKANVALVASLLALLAVISPRRVQCSRCQPQLITNVVYRVSTNDFLRIYSSGRYAYSQIMREGADVPTAKLQQFVRERSEEETGKELTRFMELQELLSK